MMKTRTSIRLIRILGYLLIASIAIPITAVVTFKLFFVKRYPYTVAEAVSPDHQWIATLELVDNGAGMGLGMLYDEIHIRRPNQQIQRHLDWPNPAVFCTDAMAAINSVEPRIMWRDSTHLVIMYDPARSVNPASERATSFHGVKIEYVATPSADM